MQTLKSKLCFCLQGSKDMHKLRQTVGCILKRKSDFSVADDAEACNNDADEYMVHMGVLTACLGKRIPVVHNSVMASTMRDALQRHGGSVYYMPRSDEVILFLLGTHIAACVFCSTND